jgi:hypothetical protein
VCVVCYIILFVIPSVHLILSLKFHIISNYGLNDLVLLCTFYYMTYLHCIIMKLYSHAWFVIWQLMTNFFCFPLMSLNQGYCFSCTNSGNNLRHPKGVRYAGGHVMRTFRPFGGLKMPPGYCDDDVRMMIYFLARVL